MLSFSNRPWSLPSLCQRYTLLRRFLCRPIPLIYGDALLESLPQNSVLILPPSDYWAMNTTLNVKTEKEAALFGAALFDLSDEYRYEALKTGQNNYTIIAYNPIAISEKLQACHAMARISAFTFAQWVFGNEPYPIRLNNGKVLTTLEGVVIEIDTDYIHTNTFHTIDEALAEPRFFIRTIPVERLLATGVTSKTLKTTLVLLLIVLGNLTANAVLEIQETARLDEIKQEMLEGAKLPETSFERDAILASLQKKEHSQLRLREQFLHISDLSVHATPPIAANTQTSSVAPSSPLPVSSPTDGVVLIPGSKPGEPNRLLVGETSSIPTPPSPVISFQGEGIEEIVYDGKNIKMLINGRDERGKERLKKAITNAFKKGKVSEQGNQLEVIIP